MIVVKELWKIYGKGERKVEALKGINVTIKDGEFVAIFGPSGSGKTTLLNCLSGIDSPTNGEIYFDDLPFHTLSEEQKTQFRARHMGFVFQFFNLIPVLTALENVLLPLKILGINHGEAKQRVVAMLERVGLRDKIDRFPSQLSGGEQQRVAIARALVHNPKVVWADEPTGNLDSETGMNVIELLESMKKELGTTLVVVTHDERIAQRADRILFMRDGRITEVREKENLNNES
ncbi:MAG: ABC transporter ATP-binding protein [Pseudothermotoga sp.]|uniref:Macrolide ABC transporter ATP-binding protein n=1 Tax=Pseudothermotoga hypogea DSM 11164 = NBRC 106472 TaxID=1123384 RepID=A0A0X1KQA4_9THEM|nr:ABC transporter ATP-binding protein [Pseudothermotoga hypogea]AJC73495.1 macrolide ABC transporter ATP-binding protein [Pseudothermotoga hypogea DSM 11164 = NBRC 106472]MBC7116895.1 ABC transporter ATP-binding protein [Pseudothermotoga sp.]